MSQKPFGRLDWVIAALIIVAAFSLHVIFLTHAGGLWRDETHLLNLSNESSFRAMSQDSFPVFMTLVLRFWSAIGPTESDAYLRFLGFVIGLLLLGSTILVSWSTNRKPPFPSLTLIALNPMFIFYGDSLRAYGLGTALIILSCAAVWKIVEKPNVFRTALATLTATLAAQTLFHNCFLIAALCAGGWAIATLRRSVRIAISVFIVAMGSGASMILYLPKYTSMAQSAAGLRTGFRPWLAWLSFTTGTDLGGKPYRYAWFMLAAIVLVLAGYALVRLRKSDSAFSNESALATDKTVFVAVILVTGITLYLGFLRFTALATQSWYFMPLLALASVCFDTVLNQWSGTARAAVIGFAAGTALISFPISHQSLQCRYTSMDIIAQKLKAEAAPQDFIVIGYWGNGISFQRYYRGSTPWTTLPPITNHLSCRVDLIQEKLADVHTLDPVFDQMGKTLRNGGKVWFIGSWNPEIASRKIMPASLSPPPLPGTGWSELPYIQNWIEQATCFIARESTEFDLVTLPIEGNVYFDENPPLAVASGWTGNPAPSTR